ncbi:bifunctional demethylmenaquinone methyltransferase/2-methoxy-6-polyprenyl-1,4-benzoquinol methylase UbiE [Treponema pedis]|uniref:Demethylmenaquinone methyltransferase n=1 Tax=Treponema pedis str. T A4 TaxID=1291379 RepID=S5ZMB2_9SPIR|nr:bifunctional demethylmenaquinone methyltransferase/2-methoxy-6-polyprenyl-1,4-benzoquinol methylase UbiE [Treponema pedis]AGT43737.1 ubiquinone/menaquinone biosynthesismethyltransferase UBIE [Treponema pedis str. T A4]
MKTETKEKKVHKIFETISDRYDKANNRISIYMHKKWKMNLVNKIIKGSSKGNNILDVCCGTGDIAIWTAKKRRDISVTGIDFSSSMLQKARQKSIKIKNITWQQADALKLPFPDNTFDSADISFGLRNTSEYEKVLFEMKRVVKKGSNIYCLDSFIPENKFIRPFHKFYFKHIVPVLGGGIHCHKEYLWLYESTSKFLGKKDLMKLYSKIGLANTACYSYFFGCCALICGQK